MKFGAHPVGSCVGAVLVHAVYLETGRIRKGTRLTEADIDRLRDAGIESVIVARLEAGDVDEDSAADQLAACLLPSSVRLSVASTGRVNIYATTRGIVRFDRDRLKAINMIDEGITLACVQHNQLVEDGDMIATLKIIPYSVTGDAIAAVQAAAGDDAVVEFHPLTACPFALIQTRVDGMNPAILANTEKVTKQRLNRLDCALVDSRIVAHDSAVVTAAIQQAQDNGAEAILVCGASAISDRRDVVPAAVERAGGTVDRIGLPADPGNLLMAARIGDVPLIGMPGCARSLRLNGFDWVLHLVLAGIPLGDDEIADMAIGGLLMEIASRPLPRKMVERRQPDGVDIAGVLLAAGMSSRMGDSNKLLVEIDGMPMVRHAAQAMLAGGIEDLVVVTGHQAPAIEAALSGLNLRFAHNPDFADGQSCSVAAGIAAMPASASGALIALGDMPYLSADLVAEMVQDHARLGDHNTRISFPVYDGRRGNPVLWGSGFFKALQDLTGDIGGREILAAHPAAVNSITWRDDSIHRDIDNPDDMPASGSGL